MKKTLTKIRSFAIKMYLKYFVSDKPKKTMIGSFSLIVNGKHALPRYLSISSTYSRNLPRLARHLKEYYPHLKMIDVGANVGDTVALVRSEVTIPILCVEGDTRYFDLLKKNLEQFNDTEGYQCFLGEKEGVVKGSIVGANGTLHIEEEISASSISIVTLDNFIRKHPKFTESHLLKIDTDGYDAKIIRGGWNFIASKKPVLFLEWDRSFLQSAGDDGVLLLKQLSKIGYRRIMFYDNLGRFLVSLTLEDMDAIKQLYLYTYKKKGAFPYYDIAVFPKEDDAVALSFIQKELSLQNGETFFNLHGDEKKYMRVLFDHQAWSNQRFGGVSRSYSEIAREFDKIPNFSYDIALLHANNDYIQTNAKVAKATRMFADKKSVLSRLRTVLRKSDRIKKWYTLFKGYVNTKASIRALKKGDFDVFHPTYYDPYFLPYLGEKPFVITVYDMIHELYPEYFLGKNTTSPRKKLLAEKATKIIAISENTKNDLVKILGIPPEKIEVVHLATTFGDVVPKQIDAPKRYILYVGSRVRYKNFSVALRGAAPLLLAEKDLFLFCAGGGEFTEKEKALIKELGVENKVIRKDADDGELSYLYRNAECFVFASKYEGFGIPILEALACHCPIILSNASCFPEIATDAAEYFVPNDPSSLSDALRKVCGHKNHREELIRRGDIRSRDFSWKKSAEQTIKIYESCLY